MPKALVPVAGRPLIDWVYEKLKLAGIGDIVVNVHHFADMIEDHLGGRALISDERKLLLDTGGGILKAEPLLDDGDFFLVHNVDILSNADLKDFIFRWRTDALAMLMVSRRKTSRYLLFDDGMRLVGWTNTLTGEVRSPINGLKPESCRAFAFAGVHLLSTTVFDVMKSNGWDGKFPIMDFYLSVCDRYPVYGYAPEGLKLLDVGKPGSLEEAERFVRR